MARALHEHRVGETVAGYYIERVIGRGGSATVYRATRDGHAVALKIMHERDPSGVTRKRFRREAALVQRLDHPNVVRVHDFGHTDRGLPYIVFELLRGHSLKTAMKREGALGVERSARITLQILEALMAAHAMGIVHRDIKPANVFLSFPSDDEEVARVLDFGLAKAFAGGAEETTTLTKTGYRLGTPRYMSPEMARGEKDVGELGDVYSLGLVLAEMIGGRPVVRDEAQMQILMRQASKHELALDDAVLGSPFGDIVTRSIAKRREDRPASARAMYDEITGVLEAHERALEEAARAAREAAMAEAPTMVYRPEIDIERLITQRMPPRSAQSDDQAPTTRVEPIRSIQAQGTAHHPGGPTPAQGQHDAHANGPSGGVVLHASASPQHGVQPVATPSPMSSGPPAVMPEERLAYGDAPPMGAQPAANIAADMAAAKRSRDVRFWAQLVVIGVCVLVALVVLIALIV